VWEAKAAVPFEPPLYVRRRATMSDTNKPRERFAPDKLAALLKVAGFTDTFYARRSFEIAVRQLGDAYWAGTCQPTVAEYLDLLQQHVDSLAAVSKQQQSLAPIQRITLFVENSAPDQLGDIVQRYQESTSEPYFPWLDEMLSAEPDGLADGIERRVRTIRFLIANPELFAQMLNRSGMQDYRKRPIRATVVEPFFKLMDDFGIVTHRTTLPRKALFDLLFDYIGIEDADRPTNIAMIKAHKSLK
jgi:hypothetical protein